MHDGITFDDEILRARISNDTGCETGCTAALAAGVDLNESVGEMIGQPWNRLTPVGETFSANLSN